MISGRSKEGAYVSLNVAVRFCCPSSLHPRGSGHVVVARVFQVATRKVCECNSRRPDDRHTT